jgi:hypothetical protein
VPTTSPLSCSTRKPGNLHLRPGSPAHAAQLRLVTARIIATANSVVDTEAVRAVFGANTLGSTMSWDGRRGFVRGDRRQIQTAVLGSAESEDPLMLPLEAIELDAFRRRHEHDTFWCGLLLGGCGLQFTTKLYTDRVCSLSSAAY